MIESPCWVPEAETLADIRMVRVWNDMRELQVDDGGAAVPVACHLAGLCLELCPFSSNTVK
jgi:hypothetical protein